MFLPLTIHCQTSPRFCYHILTQIIVEYGLSGHFDASLECNQVSFNAPLLKSSIETNSTIQEMDNHSGNGEIDWCLWLEPSSNCTSK